MLEIVFEFVGGPNDGRILEGRLGEPSDAERHYLFSNHGCVGQRFAIASDYAIEALASGGLTKEPSYPFQRHHYVVTNRQEEAGGVRVRAEYVPSEDIEPAPEADDEEADDSESLEGRLLIASPRMHDDWFTHSIVLVLHQDDDETFGVTLNCPTSETVSQLWKEVSEIGSDSKQPVYLGGPEEGPVLAIHTDGSSADIQVLPDLFVAVERDTLNWLVQQDEITYRLFVGATSWKPGQLEEEIAQGDWLVAPASNELLLADPDCQWHEALREVARSFYRSLRIKHFPDNPEMN